MTGFRAKLRSAIGIVLEVLASFGISRFSGTSVLRFNLPEKYRNGYETLSYSFRLMKGMHPDNYRAALQNFKGSLLLLVGSEDEAFYAEGFKAGIQPYKADSAVGFVNGGSHLGITMSEFGMMGAARWLARP